jgi:hypothetical protein
VSETAQASVPLLGDATGLALALTALGLPCMVEAHERLAVIVPTAAVPDLVDAKMRREVQSLATAHGFTHVALDLGE